ALGVFVGEHRSRGFENRLADEVLRRDQLEPFRLTFLFVGDGACDFGIGFGQRARERTASQIRHRDVIVLTLAQNGPPEESPYERVSLPPKIAARGNRRCLPVRLLFMLSMKSNDPSRSSRIDTSAGAPTRSVPSPLNAGNVAAALAVTIAITCASGTPSMRSFDITLGRSTTCSARPASVQSEEMVSGRNPAL